MDRLTFVAAVIKALAWPLTVLGIFFVLRRPLVALVPLLGRLRFKDLELGVVDARQAAVFHELRSLRNSAAHALGFEPSPEAARRRRADGRAFASAAL